MEPSWFTQNNFRHGETDSSVLTARMPAFFLELVQPASSLRATVRTRRVIEFNGINVSRVKRYVDPPPNRLEYTCGLGL